MPSLQFSNEQRRATHQKILNLAIEGRSLTWIITHGQIAQPITVRSIWHKGYPKLGLPPVKEALEAHRHQIELSRSKQKIQELELQQQLVEQEKEAQLALARSKEAQRALELRTRKEEEKQLNEAILTTTKANSLTALSMSHRLLERCDEYSQQLLHVVEARIHEMRRNGALLPYAEVKDEVRMLRDVVRLAKDVHQMTKLAVETENLLRPDGDYPTSEMGVQGASAPLEQRLAKHQMVGRFLAREMSKQRNTKITVTIEGQREGQDRVIDAEGGVDGDE